MEAIFTPPRLGCKARFSEVFQLAAVQTPVLSSPSSAPGWAVSAKHVVMQQVAEETRVAFERRLERARVPAPQRPDYQKWVRFYLDFWTKYGHFPALPTSLGPFLTKLAAKNQSVGQRSKAAAAVRLLIQAGPEPGPTPAPRPATPASRPPATLDQTLRARSCPLPPPAPRVGRPPPSVAQRRIPDPSRATRHDRSPRLPSRMAPTTAPTPHQTVPGAAPEPPRSLTVVPPLVERRYYGEATVGVRWGYGGMSRW